MAIPFVDIYNLYCINKFYTFVKLLLQFKGQPFLETIS